MENEQKKQTIETLRQTIKEWDISWRIGETVSRIKIDTYNWTGFHTLRGILNQNIREIRIEILQTAPSKRKRWPTVPFCEFYYIIGRTVRILTNTFQCDKRNVHIPFTKKIGRQSMMSVIISMKIQRKQCRRRLNGCRLPKQADWQCTKIRWM